MTLPGTNILEHFDVPPIHSRYLPIVQTHLVPQMANQHLPSSGINLVTFKMLNSFGHVNASFEDVNRRCSRRPNSLKSTMFNDVVVGVVKSR